MEVRRAIPEDLDALASLRPYVHDIHAGRSSSPRASRPRASVWFGS